MRIEDFALVGDTQTAALVGRDGSIDWLCLPRFDSRACFAALLGTAGHGRWKSGPAHPVPARVTRRYRPGTLVLETEAVTPGGVVRVVDCMPVRGEAPDVVRLVEGVSGRVAMRMELVVRFDYGSSVPWVRRTDGALQAVAGPDALELRTPVETRGEGWATFADFEVAAGDRVPFVLAWHPSHRPPPHPVDAERAVAGTERWWQAWSARCVTPDLHRDRMLRSLITLKALTYAPTGGIVRNWDYRYCWLRDATFAAARTSPRTRARSRAAMTRARRARRSGPSASPTSGTRRGWTRRAPRTGHRRRRRATRAADRRR